MTMYFKDCKTLDDAKKLYFKLAMKLHPDHGGTTAEFQELNKQFQSFQPAGAAAAGEEKAGAAPADLVEIIKTLLNLSGLKLELCGSWIWISGETKANKEELKAAGCRYASKKQMWYYTAEPARRSSHSVDMQDIRSKYGSKIIHGAAAAARDLIGE